MSFLDELDLRLLDILQKNPTNNYTKIGELISSDPDKPIHRNTVHKRIKKLREHEILHYPTCVIDPIKIGFQGVGVICLKIEPLQVENSAKVLASRPEVTCIGTTMGAFDIAFQVVTRDAKELQHFINNHIRTLPGFVSVQISTFVELYKNTHEIKIPTKLES